MGHLEVCHEYAPNLCMRVEKYKDRQTLPLSTVGFSNLPFLVEIIPPRAGYVYVTRESNEKIIPGNEMYNRMLIEDGTLPKEVEEQVYQQMVEDKKQDMASNKDDRRKYGETAPLGLKLLTVKTANDGDCFFDAVCKAFTDTTVTRHADMWAAAFHGADLPDPTEPLPRPRAARRAPRSSA